MSRPKMSDKKEKILICVEDMIAERGVNSFSLGDIAKKMKISKGTLYYYYQAKDDIILDIIEKHINELEGDYTSWLMRHKDDTISKERFLEVIFYKGVKLFNRAKLHIYIINECLRDNPSLKEKYNTLWNQWRKRLEQGISQVFPEVEDKETFSYLLMLIIDGLTVREALEDHAKDEKNIVEYIAKEN